MRKLLAGFLATAMVASLGATMTFAAATNATIPINTPTGFGVEAFDPTASAAGGVGEDNGDNNAIDNGSAEIDRTAFAAGSVNIRLITNTGEVFTFENQTGINNGATAAQIATAFIGAEDTQYINGTNYTMKLSASGANLLATVSPAGTISFTLNSVDFSQPILANAAGTDGTLEFFCTVAGNTLALGALSNGSGGVNNITDGDDMYYTQALVCDTSGTPIALVESKDDRNGADGVKSDATVYFALNEPYSNPDLFKVKANKGKNAKNVKAITVVEKRFSDPLVKLSDGGTLAGTAGVRRSYVKVELAELFTDDEYKITYDLKISTESKGEKLYPNFADVTLKEDDIATVWLKNKVTTADGEFRVGTGGLMLNPLQNDWNEVTYYDEDSDLAFLKFFADSDVDKFYAKLSTKWEHADYASYFNDQDAYIFDFVGSPKISATSRCDLQIYNPFVNEDGEETIDPSSATIYQVIDGDLFDVTDSFKYEEGDNGEMAYTTRTRFLGTYIICEKPVEEAVDNTEEVPADLVPEDTTPSEVTPDNNSGGKAPANTGKYL